MNLCTWWRYKWRRRFYKPFNRLIHRGHYFVCRYFGADFLVNSENVGGLEISAHIGEYRELQSFIRVCREIRPDVFIDIGANLGLYTCIVMKNGLAPRTILFEPDRRNRVHLRANFLINDLLTADIEINEVALGAAPGNFRLIPGPERDIGLSQIVERRHTHSQDAEVLRFAPTPVTEIVQIDVSHGLCQWIERVLNIILRAQEPSLFGGREEEDHRTFRRSRQRRKGVRQFQHAGYT